MLADVASEFKEAWDVASVGVSKAGCGMLVRVSAGAVDRSEVVEMSVELERESATMYVT